MNFRSSPLRSLQVPLGLVLTCSLVSCWSTQRWPETMQSSVDVLPAGDVDDYPPGEEEVTVLRHADSVYLRLAGAEASHPMSFYRRSRSVLSGSWVITSPGGRAEIIWPGGGTLIMFGNGAGVIGSPKRGEPTFIFKKVERARLELTDEDQVELLGGAVLTSEAGPVTLELLDTDILRVHNDSRGVAEVAFRDTVFDIGPGEILDLPVLQSGGTPYALDPGIRQEIAGPFQAHVRGAAERLPQESGLRFRADAEDLIEARGVRVELAGESEITFLGLAGEPASGSASGSALPQPEDPPAIKSESSGAEPQGPDDLPESDEKQLNEDAPDARSH